MKQAIETRELLTLMCGQIRLRGTHHRCPDVEHNAPLAGNARGRIGVLFLNSGFLPRAAYGDSAVYWADSLARRGYPAFRFDLPGLGDSDGDLPADVLGFVDRVNSGNYTPYVSDIAEALVERFGLSGVVLVGHCAGAATAIYAAENNRNVKGLILLDPYFHLQQPAQKVAQNISPAPTRLAGPQQCAAALPSNANLPLIRCWTSLASARFRMLVLTAGAGKMSAADFDYVRHFQRELNNERLAIKTVEGTNHSFVSGCGKYAVRELVQGWMDEHFRPSDCALGETPVCTTV